MSYQELCETLKEAVPNLQLRKFNHNGTMEYYATEDVAMQLKYEGAHVTALKDFVPAHLRESDIDAYPYEINFDTVHTGKSREYLDNLLNSAWTLSSYFPDTTIDVESVDMGTKKLNRADLKMLTLPQLQPREGDSPLLSNVLKLIVRGDIRMNDKYPGSKYVFLSNDAISVFDGTDVKVHPITKASPKAYEGNDMGNYANMAIRGYFYGAFSDEELPRIKEALQVAKKLPALEQGIDGHTK